jgi:hypothetical protein
MGSYRDLDSFTAAMFEAALFAENDQADDSGGEPLDRNYGIEDFAKPTFDGLVADAKQFQRENAEDIERWEGSRGRGDDGKIYGGGYERARRKRRKRA